MYQTIASGGFSTPLRAIRDVLANDGQPLTRYRVDVAETVDSRAVYLLQYALQEVVQSGTARSAAAKLPPGLTVAGKTGTTDEQRDSWFAGYSGDLLAVVWVGRDDNGVTPLTGATGALPIWTELMASTSRRPLRAAAPEGVHEVWVDDVGGGLSSAECPNVRRMPFLIGTEPDYDADCKRGTFHWPWERRDSEQPPPDAAYPPPPNAPPPPPTEKKKWWERWFGD
jgi:penicillin-binding protein 1B